MFGAFNWVISLIDIKNIQVVSYNKYTLDKRDCFLIKQRAAKQNLSYELDKIITD